MIAGVRRYWILHCVAFYSYTFLMKHSRGILPLACPYTAESASQLLLWPQTLVQQLSPCFQPIVYLEAVCPAALEINFYCSLLNLFRGRRPHDPLSR